MLNAISASDIAFIMSSSTSAWFNVCLSLRLRQITQTSVLIIHDIMRKPNSIIVYYNASNIFAHDSSKGVTWLNAPQHITAIFPNFQSWRITNTIASTWSKICSDIFTLDIICSSRLAIYLSENCMLLGTDHVLGQISEHNFALSGAYC